MNGKGGITGLTEDQKALKKWIFHPSECQNLYGIWKCLSTWYCSWLDYRHHDESMSMQGAFQKEISCLTEKIREYRNSFFEINDGLIVLDSRICVVKNCVKLIRDIEIIRKSGKMTWYSKSYIKQNKNS